MPSFSHKLALLVDTYNHAKTSPAYRELNIKYKTLKATNQELIHLLTNVLSKTVHSEELPKPKRRNKRSNKLNRIRCSPKNVIVKEEPIESETENVEYEQVIEDSEETEIIECNVAKKEVKVIEMAEEPEEKEEEVGEYVEETEVDVKEPEHIKNEEEMIEAEDDDAEEMVEKSEEVEIVEEEIVKEVEEGEEETVEAEEGEEEIVEAEEGEEVEVSEEETGEVVEEETEEVEGDGEEEGEEEAGVYEIEINGTRYYTTDEQNGTVYAVLDDDEVGDEVGSFVNGKFQPLKK